VAEITYWLKGSSELNFGDYLSEYLSNHLFLQTPRRPVEIRVIGSVLHDGFVPTEIAPQPPASPSAEGPTPIGGPRERLIAWGCGIREPGGLSPDHRALVEILSVRGPVSAADLALGPEVPQGDPAFLLPALYTPRHSEAWSDKAVCIPHFHDRRRPVSSRSNASSTPWRPPDSSCRRRCTALWLPPPIAVHLRSGIQV